MSQYKSAVTLVMCGNRNSVWDQGENLVCLCQSALAPQMLLMLPLLVEAQV